MRILIVDDDPGMLNALRVGLTSVGHQSSTAGNGQEALDLLQSSIKIGQPFDLMVTDLRMPKVDGLDLIRLFRQVCPGVPCILMTAYGTEHLKKDLSALGGCGYLEKPFSPAELHRVIDELWGHPTGCPGRERIKAIA